MLTNTERIKRFKEKIKQPGNEHLLEEYKKSARLAREKYVQRIKSNEKIHEEYKRRKREYMKLSRRRAKALLVIDPDGDGECNEEHQKHPEDLKNKESSNHKTRRDLLRSEMFEKTPIQVNQRELEKIKIRNSEKRKRKAENQLINTEKKKQKLELERLREEQLDPNTIRRSGRVKLEREMKIEQLREKIEKIQENVKNFNEDEKEEEEIVEKVKIKKIIKRVRKKKELKKKPVKVKLDPLSELEVKEEINEEIEIKGEPSFTFKIVEVKCLNFG